MLLLSASMQLSLLLLSILLTNGQSDSVAPPVALIVQFSDLHVSKYEQGSRMEDLEALSQQLLSVWRPDSIVITGDLTDAKLPNGRGEQLRSEWREYKRILRILSESSGLRTGDVLDIRGNHDVFDNIRGGPDDHYMTLSARASRQTDGEQSAFRRINIDPVFAMHYDTNSRYSDRDRSTTGQRGLASKHINSDARTHFSFNADAGANSDAYADAASAADADADGYDGDGGRYLESDGSYESDGSMEDGGDQGDLSQGSSTGGTVSGSSISSSSIGGGSRSLSNAATGGSESDAHDGVDGSGQGHGNDRSSSGDASSRSRSDRDLGSHHRQTDAEDSYSSGEDNRSSRRARKRPHCPLAVMVGIDGTPDLGLRPATNFLAVVGPDLLQHLDATLARLKRLMSLHGCQPSIVAYGHHTLSTTAYVSTPVMHSAHGHGPLSEGNLTAGDWLTNLEHATATSLGSGMDTTSAAAGALTNAQYIGSSTRLEDVLGRWDTSAYLCGHLHDTFGHRTHRMHPKKAPFTTGYLAELEIADWKHSRWFRIVTADDAAGVSFADFRFLRDLDQEGDAEEPFEIISIDDSRRVSSFVVVITSPPDARYYPLRVDHASSAAAPNFPVRALLLPLEERVRPKGSALKPPKSVMAWWRCQRAGKGEGEEDELKGVVELLMSDRHHGSNSRDASTGRRGSTSTGYDAGGEDGDGDDDDDERPKTWLYEGSLASEPDISLCGRHVHVKVVADETRTSGEWQSTSEWRPVARRAIYADPRSRGGTAADDTIPLDLILSERIILNTNWEVFGDTAFYVQWGVMFVGLLLLPRFLPFVFQRCFSVATHFCFPPFSSHAGGGSAFSSSHAGGAAAYSSLTGGGPSPPISPSLHSSGSGFGLTKVVPSAASFDGTVGSTSGAGGTHSASDSHMHHIQHNHGAHPPPHMQHNYAAASHTPKPVRSNSIGSSAGGSMGVSSPCTIIGMPSSASPLHSVGTCRAWVRQLAWPIYHLTWLVYYMFLRPPMVVLLLCIISPLRDLSRLSIAHPGLWGALVLFAANLLIGPWFVGSFHHSSPGLLGSFLTSHGVYLYESNERTGVAGYVMIDAQDVSIITNVHMATFVLPITMWLASVVCQWSDLAAGKPEGVLLLTWRQVVVLLVVLPIHYRLLGKISGMYGPAAVLISPAAGWAVPLAVLWLRHARLRVIKCRVD